MDKVLNPLARTSRVARCFSTTARNAAPGPSRKPRQADDFAPSLDIRDLDVYKFDDPTSLGWLRLEKIREVQELFRKLEVDKPVLQGEHFVLNVHSKLTFKLKLKSSNHPRRSRLSVYDHLSIYLTLHPLLSANQP